MFKNIIIISLILVVITALGYAVVDFLRLDRQVNPKNSFLSPISKTTSEVYAFNTDLEEQDYMHILLLGIDRRSKQEAYRTDTMILVSINKKDNKVVLTSVPRDLWYGGGRINALYLAGGFEELQKAYEKITNVHPQRYILTDFEDFKWIIDAMGGVNVNVETSFTDSGYPVDETFEYQTVTFTQGVEKMTGERALIFSRSRKGDNDNGDWGRMKRQHLILKGTVNAAVQPQSFICNLAPKTTEPACVSKIDKDVLQKALETVTNNKMKTNLQLNDLMYLWDFYKDKDKYEIESLLMDYEYVHTPPMEDYGGAWVLAPVGNSYAKFHQALQAKLNSRLDNVQE